MAREVATLDLRALDVAPGSARRLRLRVPPVELRLGGQDYATDPASPEIDLEVARSLSGLHLRLRAQLELVGPCVRCLADARAPLGIDASEFDAEGHPDESAEDDDELRSEYVEDGTLDLARWFRDAVAEVVPPTILCREDCAGLCAVCGADLNVAPCDCRPSATDPRWDALRGLAERLGREE